MHRLVHAGIAAVMAGAATLGAATLSASSQVQPAPAGPAFARVCSPANDPGSVHCNAIQLLDPAVNWHGHDPAASAPNKTAHGGKGGGGGHGGGGGPTGPTGGGAGSAPPGYGPAQLESAYALGSAISSFATAGQVSTVAVVDAYDDPNAESDLGVYRSTFGLPPCTTADGCFSKVNQAGGSSYPSANSAWAEEISLDLDMVSAACPGCHILLVEASSNSWGNLGAAEDYAATHANAVSNSYSSPEFAGETSDDVYYDHPGVSITASAGDSGYGVEYPAVSPFVVAVGGTTLQQSSSARGWSESVWSGTGAGCSVYETNPGWQPVTSLCGSRTAADVAADADPGTGVASYDTYGEPGWLVFGGTSVAAPFVAAVYALAGNTSTFTTSATGSTAGQGLYGAALNRVSSGSDSQGCASYLCNAADSLASGYNAPTGNGTPNGTAGF